jgi:hypothetical protein
MVSTEATPGDRDTAVVRAFCLDGPLVTQDTAAMTGRSVEGLSSARTWRRGHQLLGR